MNKRIDFSTMPKVFGMCNMADCPQAETCLRHLAYEVADADRPFIDTLNPRWLAKHKGLCRFYLINETVKRPRGFIRTLKALPTGKADSFRLSAMAKMGYRRYYQTRKGEIKWWTHHIYQENPNKVITMDSLNVYKVRVTK